VGGRCDGRGMYGKAHSPRQATAGGHTRSSPYSSQQDILHDALQHAAMENLLKAVAARAATMEVKDILALSAAFSSSSSINPTAAIMAAAPVPGGGGYAGGNLSGGASAGVGIVDSSLSGGSSASSDKGCSGVGTAREAGSGSLSFGAGSYNSVSTGMDALALATQAPPAGPLPLLDEVVGGMKTVKVSVRAHVKSVAGALSKTLRSSDGLVATAVGPDGVNHAIKALCITRCYLAAEGLDITSTVSEVQMDGGISLGRCFAIMVVRMGVAPQTGPLCQAGIGRTEPLPRFVRAPELQTELKSSGQGEPSNLAGAIAKCLRDDKEVIIACVGPASVAKGIEALALARSYVRSDGVEMVFYPQFETIMMQGVGPGAGESRSAVKLHVWPETLGAA